MMYENDQNKNPSQSKVKEYAKNFILLIISFIIVSSLIQYFGRFGDMKFQFVSIDGTVEEFVIQSDFVKIIRKAAHDEEISQYERQYVSLNVPKNHAWKAYKLFREEWYKQQGFDGITIRIAASNNADDFVNQVYKNY